MYIHTENVYLELIFICSINKTGASDEVLKYCSQVQF